LEKFVSAGLLRNARVKRRALGAACFAHVLHDGYSDLLYLLLPVWQREFELSFAAIGLMKGAFSGALSLFQIPAAQLAARCGERVVLAGGAGLIAVAVFSYGFAQSAYALGVMLVVAGLAASVQHPLSSNIVAGAFGGSRAALGVYNFAGDAGKVLFPSAAAALIWIADWRMAAFALGAAGAASALALYWLIPNLNGGAGRPTSDGPETNGCAKKERLKDGFTSLTSIGMLDYATRAGFLTFMPLLLSEKGASPALIGTALSLVFIGGAAGKLACGILAERIGTTGAVIVTEAITAISIASLPGLSLEASLMLFAPLGVALNGTSSALYGSVAELAPPSRRANAFAIFYTATLGVGAVAPALFGALGDAAGLGKVLMVVAVLPVLTIPLAYRLGKSLGVDPPLPR
jgi:MFS transporter, FSR family, fosmidomycin resistance protein